MHDLAYLVAGYGLTAVAFLGFRWRLAVRERRAHRLVAALGGRPRRGRS